MIKWTVLKRFGEKKLPDKECFYSFTKDGTTGNNGEKFDSHISNEEYLMHIKVLEKFGMKNLGDYHYHYLEKDFAISWCFRCWTFCLKFYRLDPCHYFSSPGLSWDAMLKMTVVRLEKIADVDMYLFIEKGLERGISCIARRYAKSNNKYTKNYDPKKRQIL